MKNNLELLYCAEWAKDRERSWSGTTYGLRQALCAHFQLRDFDLPNCSESLIFRLNNRVRNYLGIRDFELSKCACSNRNVISIHLILKRQQSSNFLRCPRLKTGNPIIFIKIFPLSGFGIAGTIIQNFLNTLVLFIKTFQLQPLKPD